jgi:serine protease DegQ
LQKDDVIVAINREPVQNLTDMRKVMDTKPAIVALHIIRGDNSLYILAR